MYRALLLLIAFVEADCLVAQNAHELPKPISVNAVGAGSVFDVAFTHDGKTISACSGKFGQGGGRLTTWDSDSGAELDSQFIHRNAASAITYSKDGRYAATASIGEFLRPSELLAWELNAADLSGSKIHHFDVFAIWDVQFSSDGKTLIAAHDAYKVTFWDMESGQLKHTVDDLEGKAMALALCPKRDEVAVADSAGYVHRISLTSFQTVESIRLPSYCSAVTYSTDGINLFASGGAYDVDTKEWQEFRIWKYNTMDKQTTVLPIPEFPKALIALGTDRVLVSTQPHSENKKASATQLIVLESTPLQVKRSFRVPDRILCLAVAPNENTIVAGTLSGKVTRWETKQIALGQLTKP